MQPETPPARRKLPVVKLAAAAAALVVLGLLALRGLNLRALGDQAMALVRSAGPWAFFGSIAVLPAAGVPLTAFTITAGEVFGPLLTLGGVIAAALSAIAVNLALTYWLGRYALKPLLVPLVGRYGYRIPTVTPANALSVALAVRLTPGPPFFLQGYILALAEVPFRLYMVVSWLSIVPWSVGAIVLGKGVFNGNFRLVLYGVAVIVVATIAVQALRQRYVRRDS